MRLISAFILLSVCPVWSTVAQSLSGVPGLVTVPIAHVPPDRTVRIGLTYLNRTGLAYHDHRFHAKRAYVSIVYLPFLEIGMRFTRVDSNVEEALGDRSAVARLLIRKESVWMPAVVLGIHDFAGSKRHFHALYAVASKKTGPASVHLGYGTDIIDAALYKFVGIFGGVALSPIPGVRVMAEYDGIHFNGGVDARLFDGIHLIAASPRFEAFSAGISVSMQLPE